ncbi:MAG TPA: ATP-binding protein [Candidatus Acidoferrales bacterium]
MHAPNPGPAAEFEGGFSLWSRLRLSRISFSRQIILLGIIAVVLLFAVLVATFAALQYTRSAVLKNDQRHLAGTTRSLVREYNDQAEVARQNHRPDLLEKSAIGSSQDALAGLSKGVLQNVEGVEGGFYALAEDTLVGGSYPARGGAISKSNTGTVSADSRPDILQVARDAVLSRGPSARVLTRGQDLILIDALPLQVGQRYVGSAWTVMRLSSLPGTNRFRTYLIAVGLGIAAFACVLLTLLVVRELQSGVRKIESGLEDLERNLASEIPIETDPEEIRQIARAINRLGATLRSRIESERHIEDRLRHAERLAALGRLIAGVAHEVRNPLATIRLRVQMCQQDSASFDAKESCAIALQEVERLNGMVNRLLSFSRPVHLQAEPTNLGRLVEQRLGNFAELARELNVKFVAKFNRDSKPVRIDQSHIAQVFDNIIQNAIDSMAESGGTLCVNVTTEARTAESSEVSVEFNDTGGGMRSDVVSRIFDPFFTTKPSGTGLGLSICHELVQAHGGEINVASAEGCGTTVRIILPVRNQESAKHPV